MLKMMTLILGKKGETLEEYIEVEIILSDKDNDINDGDDIQDINSDDNSSYVLQLLFSYYFIL